MIINDFDSLGDFFVFQFFIRFVSAMVKCYLNIFISYQINQ